MSEVAFAKSFLALLDSKPTKLSAEHIQDPRNFSSKPPYVLPRPTRPMTRPTRSAAAVAPGSERGVDVAITSLRNPPLGMRLASQALTTLVLEIRMAVAAKTRVPVDKIKMLWRKKPVADSKALRDLVGDGEVTVDFSVMILGGATAAANSPVPATPSESVNRAGVAQGLGGPAVLETEEFWSDLKGFLQQRIRDERTAGDICGQFRSCIVKRDESS